LDDLFKVATMDALFKRILYGGIGIAIVWLMFLTVPLWLRNVNHPLTANAVIDACAYFTDAVLATLPRPPEKISAGIPGEPQTSFKGACSAELPPESRVDKRKYYVWVAVTSERMLGGDRQPVRTDKFVDLSLKESAVSGSDVTPLKGPWRRGALIIERGRPNKLSLLADDAGVVLWINAQDIEEPAFVAFSEAIAKALRAKPPIKAKS